MRALYWWLRIIVPLGLLLLGGSTNPPQALAAVYIVLAIIAIIAFTVLYNGQRVVAVQKICDKLALEEDRKSAFIEGVKNKRAIIGMPEDILMIAIGPPTQRNNTNVGNEVHKQLVYEINREKALSNYMYIEDGVLTAMQLADTLKNRTRYPDQF